MPDPSPSNADSLKLQLLTARKKRVVAGHSEQFTPGGYLSTVIHTTLVGIEPTTFRLLVRRCRDHVRSSICVVVHARMTTPLTIRGSSANEAAGRSEKTPGSHRDVPPTPSLVR